MAQNRQVVVIREFVDRDIVGAVYRVGMVGGVNLDSAKSLLVDTTDQLFFSDVRVVWIWYGKSNNPGWMCLDGSGNQFVAAYKIRTDRRVGAKTRVVNAGEVHHMQQVTDVTA